MGVIGLLLALAVLIVLVFKGFHALPVSLFAALIIFVTHRYIRCETRFFNRRLIVGYLIVRRRFRLRHRLLDLSHCAYSLPGSGYSKARDPRSHYAGRRFFYHDGPSRISGPYEHYPHEIFGHDDDSRTPRGHRRFHRHVYRRCYYFQRLH